MTVTEKRLTRTGGRCGPWVELQRPKPTPVADRYAYLHASIAEGLTRAHHDDTMAARAHLMGHDVFDFARTITQLRNELDRRDTGSVKS